MLSRVSSHLAHMKISLLLPRGFLCVSPQLLFAHAPSVLLQRLTLHTLTRTLSHAPEIPYAHHAIFIGHVACRKAIFISV